MEITANKLEHKKGKNKSTTPRKTHTFSCLMYCLVNIDMGGGGGGGGGVDEKKEKKQEKKEKQTKTLNLVAFISQICAYCNIYNNTTRDH